MPISDEVIELAPVKKTKKQLIILLAVIGVCVALAVTFLILYLLKPNVDENPIVVNAVTITGNDLYAQTEGEETKYYASIGNEYIVYANISVEKETSPMLKWEVEPAGALTEIARTELATTDAETGETVNAYFKFVPSGAHNRDVTIKVRSAADVNKSAEISFKIVNAVTHSIVAKQYQPSGGTAVDIVNNAIDIPYYKTDIRNNKTYYMSFDQFGRYNDGTEKYLPITVTGTGDSASNMVSVSSSDERVVSVQYPNANSFSFKAEGKTGTAVITITANVNASEQCDAPAEPVTCQITVNVEDNVALGYIEKIHFFDKGVVDEEFIESILDNTRNRIDTAKLAAKVRADGLKENEEFVIPYMSTYADIFSHILIEPVGIQYNLETRELNSNWQSKITITASENALTVKNLNGKITLGTNESALPSGKDSCKMTLTDNTPGGLRSKVDVNVNIIALNTTGKVAVTVGSTSYAERNVVPIAPDGEATYTVEYTHEMPGKTDIETVFERKYLNTAFMLDFDPNVLEVHIAGINDALEPDTKYNLTSSSATIVASGSAQASKRTFLTTVTLSVRVKDVEDGPTELRFIKVGSLITATTDWEYDCTWEKAMTFNVTRRATQAFIVPDSAIDDMVEASGRRFIKYAITDGEARTQATIYVQNQAANTRFDEIINDISAFATANGMCTKEVTSVSNSGGAFTRLGNRGTPEYNKLAFLGNTEFSGEQALVEITVRNANGDALSQKIRISIHVVDAIRSFVAIDAQSATYSPSNLTNIPIDRSVNNTEIKVVRVFDTRERQFDFGYNNMQVYLGYTTEESARLTPEIEGGVVYFKHDGNRLFSYSKSAGVLTPQCDLFKYSYEYSLANNNAYLDVSNIMVEISVIDTDNEYYLGENPPSVAIACKFTRQADGLKLFSDQYYSNELQRTGNAYTLNVNQDYPVNLYVSSTVNISGHDDPIVVNLRSESTDTVTRSKLTLPEGLRGVVSDSAEGKVSGTADQYYWITFNAPEVPDGGSEKVYNITLSGGENATLALTVQNYARRVSGISFCSDEAGANEISSDTALNFGRFINGNNSTQTVYIKIQYVPASSNHMYYESVMLTLPSCLKVVGNNISSSNIVLSSSNDQSNIVIYKVTPPDTDVKTDNNAKVYKCVLELNTTAVTQDGEIKLTRQSGGAAIIQHIYIGSGLSGIDVKKAGSETKSHADSASHAQITHVFELSNTNANENNELTLAFDFITLAKDTHRNIVYDTENLEVVTPTVSGLTFNETGVKSDNPTITISIDKANLTTLNGTYTLKFICTANGADENNEFIVDLNLSVTMDIYALAFGENEYRVTTNGKTGEDVEPQSKPVTVSYNEANAAVQPSSKLISDTNVVKVVKFNANTGNYDEYVGEDVYVEKSGAAYTLYVVNTVNTADKYYLQLSYGALTPVRKQIIIQTTAHYAELVQGEGTVAVSNGSAVIKVNSSTQKFSLPVAVKNCGTNETVTGKTVTYGIYKSNDDYTTSNKSDEFEIDSNGEITVKTIKGVTGTVYYRASYTDEGGTGNTTDIDVVITYKLAVTGIALKDIDTYTYKNNVITLYYADDSNYTSLDLTGHITASNGFGKAYSDNLVITVLSNATDYVGVNAATNTLIPKKATTDSGVTIEISAKYDDTTAYPELFTVVVKKVAGLNLAPTSGTIDVFANSTLTVTPNFGTFDGLTATYELTAPVGSNLNIANGTGNAKTVSLDNRQSATHGSSYDLTATLSYALKGSSLTLVGAFDYTATYTVNVGGEYVPGFKVYCDADEISAGSQHIIGSGDYTVSIDNTHGYNAATYTAASADLRVVSFKDTDDANVKDIEFKANEGGSVTIVVTVNAYGTSFTNSASYTFLRGADASAALYVGNTSTEVTNNSEIVLDYTSTAPTYQYRITNLGNGVADVVVSGASKVEKNDDSTVWTITVEKPTKITVGGTVTVGETRTIYLTPYTVTFTATKPEFTLSAADTVIAGGTLNFTLTKATGYTSDAAYTTTFAVVDGGGEIAAEPDNANIGVFTATSQLTSDRVVTVKATVEMTGGAYKGTTYTYYKTITVLGVPLPTIGWKQAETTIAVEGSVSLASLYEKVEKFVVGGSEHAYTLVIGITDSATGLVKGTDYTLTDSTLTIEETAKTKAGGKITLTIGAKVGGTVGSVNYDKNAVVTRQTIDVIITPEANPASNVVLGNAAGSYDLSGIATVYSTTTTGNFVNATVAAASKVVALSLAYGTDTTKFAVSGSTLTLKQKIDTETTVDLTATVEIVGGVYNGTRVSCDMTVTVKMSSIKSSAPGNVAWNGTGYNTVSDIAGRIQLPGGETGTVAAINIVASNAVANNDKFASVTGNNTATPSISFDRNTNLVLSATGGSGKSMKFTYTVTLSNGNKYEFTDMFTVAVVNVPVKTYLDSDNEEFTGSTVERTAGDSFVMKYTANNGFTVGIQSVAITDSSGAATNALTATYGGERVMFSAASAATGLNVDVTYVVGETTGTKQYAVNIAAFTSYAAYSIGDNNSNTVAIGENVDNIVESLWTAQTNFRYPGTLTVAVANGGSLSTYVSSIEVLNVKNERLGYVNLSTGSFTSFPTEYGGRSSVDKFKLKITYYTTTPWSCNLNVSLLTYNGAYRNASTQTVNVSYSFAVIADMTVTFNKNVDDSTATVDKDTIIVKYNKSYGYIEGLASATRTGYDDAVWYDENGNTVTASTPVTKTSNHTLYAHWTPKQVDVQFNSGDGGSNEDGIEVTFDAAYGNLPTPTKAGSRFDGWYTQDGDRVFETTIVKTASRHTLFARWSANLITVSFYDNGTLISTKAMALDATSYGTLPTAERTGYTLKWMTGTDEDATEVTASSALISTADHGLYAKWTEKTVNVSYDLNYTGQPNNPASTTVKFGSNYNSGTGLASDPTRTGYTFAGWYTAAEGGTKVETTTIVTSEDHTLYAHWTLKKVDVTLYYNDGTNNKYKAQVDYNSSFDLHTVIRPTREGYTFAGWYSTAADEEGETATAYPSAIDHVTTAINMYARWTVTKVTVTLYYNDGTNNKYTTQVDYNSSFDQHTVIRPTRTGYTFAGWYSTAADEEGETATAYTSAIEPVTREINMYARWTPNTYTVTLIDGDNISTVNATYDGTYSLTSPTKTGYGFDGWFTAKEDGSQVQSGDSVTAENRILYAKWTEKTVNVSYDLNYTGQPNNPASTTVKFGSNYNSGTGLASDPSREGYTFAGWYTAAEGGTKVETTTIVTSEDHTLYAHWTLNKYAVTLYLNDGTDTDTVVYKAEVDYNSSFELHTVIRPTRTGYTFAGWYPTKEDVEGQEAATAYISAIDHVTTAINMYARWTPNTYTVTFVDENAEIRGTSIVTFGENYTMPSNPPEKENNTLSWWTTADDSGSQVTADTKVTTASDHTLYAHWTENEPESDESGT